jgi:putative ABC transport system permease protein
VSPEVRTGAPVVFASQNWTTSIMGVNEFFLDIRSWTLDAGEFFTQNELRNSSKVCVIGATVAENLFGAINPVGQLIRIKKIPFHVIGVLTSRGQTGMGQDQDDIILAPLSTVQRRMMGISHVNMIVSSAVTEDSVNKAKEEISRSLRRRHRLAEGADEDFSIRTQADMAAMAGSTLGIIALLLGCVASVSLVVGGIGIMNIMLVSVTERTREIGIRMAIGARRNDIMTQFLVEAMALSCLGGIVGICIGAGVTNGITYFTQWPAFVSGWAAAGSFVFSGFVGVFFGAYPAWKASRLDPIDALRFE